MSNPSSMDERAYRETRRTVLELAVRLLRGAESAVDWLGWDRIYRAPLAPEPVYSQSLTEEQLATYQKAQGKTNHCAVYSVAAAINLLTDMAPHRGKRTAGKAAELALKGSKGVINYDDAVDIADRHAVLRPRVQEVVADIAAGQDFRVWPGGPTMPRQQAALARRLAEAHDLPITAEALRGTPEDLLFLLGQPGTTVILTFGWGKDERPRIVGPDGKFATFSVPDTLLTLRDTVIKAPFNAHTMLLAAYDPNRTAKDKRKTVTTPWGFVNSWIDGGSGLYWMTEDDFRRAWRYVIPGVGRQKMVVIRRSA